MRGVGWRPGGISGGHGGRLMRTRVGWRSICRSASGSGSIRCWPAAPTWPGLSVSVETGRAGRGERGRSGLRGRPVQRHVAAASGAGATVLRLPDRGGRARVQPGRPRPLHAGSAVRWRRPAAGAADGQAAVDPAESEWPRLLARSPGADPQPVDAGIGLRLGAAPGGAVLVAHRRLRSGAPDTAGPGGDDKDPPGTGRAVLRVDGGAAAELSAPPRRR